MNAGITTNVKYYSSTTINANKTHTGATMKPFSIALSPGHTPTHQGARKGNVTEYGLSSAIIGDMIFRLSKLGHIAHLIGSDTNTNQSHQINKLNPDFGLELHFNSHADSTLNGTEVLYSGAPKPLHLADCICTNLSHALKTKNRGCKIGNYQLNRRKPIIAIIRKTYCPFVVVEPLFLSNAHDYTRINIAVISSAIIQGCLDYWSYQLL
jgi:N-acetylmuramoyl-L-alanine amidase